jgi:hypothetical protein
MGKVREGEGRRKIGKTDKEEKGERNGERKGKERKRNKEERSSSV